MAYPLDLSIRIEWGLSRTHTRSVLIEDQPIPHYNTYLGSTPKWWRSTMEKETDHIQKTKGDI